MLLAYSVRSIQMWAVGRGQNMGRDPGDNQDLRMGVMSASL